MTCGLNQQNPPLPRIRPFFPPWTLPPQRESGGSKIQADQSETLKTSRSAPTSQFANRVHTCSVGPSNGERAEPANPASSTNPALSPPFGSAPPKEKEAGLSSRRTNRRIRKPRAPPYSSISQ